MPNLDITNIPPPRVPLIDDRTGLMSREWYRFFLSLFRLTGSGSNQVSLADVQVDPPVGDIAGKLALIERSVDDLSLVPVYTPSNARKAYGVFHDNNTQTAALINTAYPITFSNTDASLGVTIGTPTSRVYVDRIGTYNFQFSAQLNKATAAAKNVWIWARINGIDQADSATKVTLGGSNAAVVAAWNFVYAMNAGSYFELVWSTDDTGCQIVNIASAAPVPAIPSIILTVTDNITE